MGLFSTVLHIYKRSQIDTLNELKNELEQIHGLKSFSNLKITNFDFQSVFENEVYSKTGIFYLVTQVHGNWITIIELNVNVDNPFYLYELTNSLSKRLNTFALSFHFHDGDVLYYNLDNRGNSLDGYNSDYQYFLSQPADKEEVLEQKT